MTKAELTKAQRETLECCPDWSAPFEVADRRRGRGTNVFSRRAEVMLRSLTKRGLVEFGKPNGTYRITPAGRALIAKEAEHG
jgi:hypothetical protein